MPGLLDFLNADDAQLGVGLLAAGGPSATPMGFGQRLAAGVAQAQASKDGRLRNKLLESQIAENTSQDAVRRAQLERQQRQDAYYMGGALPGAGAAPAGGAGAGAAPTAGANPATAGAALKAAAGAPPDAPPPGQGKFAEWSKQFNIPVDALVADYFSNGGKGIADMLFKAGRPDMQVTGGYAYDKNRVQPGFLPSLNTSQDGKSTLTLVDPATRLPRVMPTPGAVDSFGAFQETSNRSAANYQPETVIDPQTLQKVVRPRSEVLQPRAAAPVLPGRPLGATGPGYAGGSASAAAGGQADILTTELQRATQEATAAQQRGDTAAATRAQQDVAAIQRELQRLPGARTGGAPLIGPGAGVPQATPAAAGNVVELSPQQQAENDANRARLVDTAKADVVRDTGKADTVKKASQMREAAGAALKLLDAGPTGSGAGALTDNVLNFVGQPTASGTAAQQLEAIGGALMANVPRMEGPQSDADVRNYKLMAGNVGDRTLPVAARKAALRTVIEIQDKYAALNGGAPAPAPAPGGLPAGWTVKVR